VVRTPSTAPPPSAQSPISHRKPHEPDESFSCWRFGGRGGEFAAPDFRCRGLEASSSIAGIGGSRRTLHEIPSPSDRSEWVRRFGLSASSGSSGCDARKPSFDANQFERSRNRIPPDCGPPGLCGLAIPYPCIERHNHQIRTLEEIRCDSGRVHASVPSGAGSREVRFGSQAYTPGAAHSSR